MKKAVILSGSKQYLVGEGDILDVELLHSKEKNVEFDVLLLIEDGKTTVGKPLVEGMKVNAQILEAEVKSDKVTAIRYKAKKRVRKVHGHRQKLTNIKILTIK